MSKPQLEERSIRSTPGREQHDEVYVGRLRRKLGADIIETVRGMGYRLGPRKRACEPRAAPLEPATAARPDADRGGGGVWLAGTAGAASCCGARRTRCSTRAAGGRRTGPAAGLRGVAVARDNRGAARRDRRSQIRTHRLRRPRRQGRRTAPVERRRPLDVPEGPPPGFSTTDRVRAFTISGVKGTISSPRPRTSRIGGGRSGGRSPL